MNVCGSKFFKSPFLVLISFSCTSACCGCKPGFDFPSDRDCGLGPRSQVGSQVVTIETGQKAKNTQSNKVVPKSDSGGPPQSSSKIAHEKLKSNKWKPGRKLFVNYFLVTFEVLGAEPPEQFFGHYSVTLQFLGVWGPEGSWACHNSKGRCAPKVAVHISIVLLPFSNSVLAQGNEQAGLAARNTKGQQDIQCLMSHDVIRPRTRPCSGDSREFRSGAQPPKEKTQEFGLR